MTSHIPAAIPQREGKTLSIVTRIPTGVVTPDMLETIASVTRKYNVPMIKLTSGQRFMLIGIPARVLTSVYEELGPLAEKETGPCVRYVQTCLGMGMCRYGAQDSMALGRELEQRYHGMAFPAKLKFGVSGCLRCCSESHVRDIGGIGTTTGGTVVFGGNSGRKPAIGKIIARDLSTDEVFDLIQRLIEYYQQNAQPKERTARFLERIGFDRLRSELLTLLPYIPLPDAE